MEKIIEVTENHEGMTCLICCVKKATLKFKLSRPMHDDIVTSFHLCDLCLARMQKEIQIQK